ATRCPTPGRIRRPGDRGQGAEVERAAPAGKGHLRAPESQPDDRWRRRLAVGEREVDVAAGDRVGARRRAALPGRGAALAVVRADRDGADVASGYGIHRRV